MFVLWTSIGLFFVIMWIIYLLLCAYDIVDINFIVTTFLHTDFDPVDVFYILIIYINDFLVFYAILYFDLF